MDLQRLYFKSIKRISLPDNKFGIIFELALRYELWDLGDDATTDSSFLAIPRNVKLEFSLDEISQQVMNQNENTISQNWALFVVEHKNKSITGDKIFNGIVFNLTSELKYYLINLSVTAPIKIDETIKTITLSSPAENAENDENDENNNKTMFTLQRIQNDQVDMTANLAKWIWYLSVLKAKVFGKFVSYIIEKGISARDQDLSLPGLTPKQSQKVAELIQTIGPEINENVLNQLLKLAPGEISEGIFQIFTPEFLENLTNILNDFGLEE